MIDDSLRLWYFVFRFFFSPLLDNTTHNSCIGAFRKLISFNEIYMSNYISKKKRVIDSFDRAGCVG